MINVLVHNAQLGLNKNGLIFNKDFSNKCDGILDCFVAMKKYGLENNINYLTEDQVGASKIDHILFVDYPHKGDDFFKYILKNKSEVQCSLLILESKLFNRNNFNEKKHKIFKQIFTWSTETKSNKYVHLPYAFDFPEQIPGNFEGRLFCSLIAGNKKSLARNQLYSKRIEIIEWFTEKLPNDFHLYGRGWNIYQFPNSPILNKLNKVEFIKKIIPVSRFSSYRGEVNTKKSILKNYKFTFSLENVYGENGYITEKIFDAFFSGTIPIYLGAPDIENYIPKNCYINLIDFENYEELLKFLLSIDRNKYLEYVSNIRSFLQSDEAFLFKSENFAKKITENILGN